MKKHLVLAVSFIFTTMVVAQNMGIGTTSPNSTALLHIDLATSTAKGFLVTGTFDFNSTSPDIGAGSRMMFYPGKSAFRAGTVTGTEWDHVNVGQFSTALGFNTIAGYQGTAIGYHTTANGGASIAIGQNSTASGLRSIAIGENNVASVSNGICIGNSTAASGILAMAMGTNTVASAIFSTTLGKNTIAKGENATAIGHYTTASGVNATSMGSFTKAKGYSSTVVGMYNDSILTSDQSSITPTTPLFIVGNGDNHTTRSNALVILKNGNMGIGITPTEKLHIAGNGVFTGAVTANCGLLTCSDIRYKKNIQPLSNVLDVVMHLTPIYYQWDVESFPTMGFDDQRQVGFSAQELEVLFPEMVHTDEAGYKTVDYSKLVPILVQAMKEQQYGFDELKAQHEMLEQQYVRQQDRIDILEKQMAEWMNKTESVCIK